MTPSHSTDAAARAASLAAFAMIAVQVCGKATRDSLLLSRLGVAALPAMTAISALLSVVAVFASAHWLAQSGPRRVVTVACATSAGTSVLLWLLAQKQPVAAAVLFYLSFSVGGALLISWFWSVINERFDPHSAKRQIAWIAGGGAAGGFVGGILAARLAASSLPASAMLLVLALLQALCAVVLHRVGDSPGVSAAPQETADASASQRGWTRGLAILRRNPQLGNLAAFVVVVTSAASLVDFIFKSQTVARLQGDASLMRFFALFYAAAGLVTLLVQWTLSKPLLENIGVARTAALLPGAVGLGGITLAIPGASSLASAAVVRGAEAVLRSSVYRSSYELLYTPISATEKRATKTAVDVGFERLGDALGAGLIQGTLWAGAVGALGSDVSGAPVLVMAGMASVLGLLGVWIAARLGRGYIASLEQSLFKLKTPGDVAVSTDVTTRSIVLESLDRLSLRRAFVPSRRENVPATNPIPGASPGSDLHSADPARVRVFLGNLPEALDATLVPQLARLLGWDAVAEDVIRTLRPRADEIARSMGEILADPDEEFSVRRRIPRVLSGGSNRDTIDALVRGLRDVRFEVRFRCVRALARIRDRDPNFRLDRELVFECVGREAAVDRKVWESHRLLDQVEPGDERSFLDDVLRERSSRGSEHVFALLSLTFPKEPLRIAFAGLQTDDAMLRGTALEYLDSIVPPRLHAVLRPLIDQQAPPPQAVRSQKDALEALLRSHASIQQNLEARRQRG